MIYLETNVPGLAQKENLEEKLAQQENLFSGPDGALFSYIPLYLTWKKYIVMSVHNIYLA